MSRGAPHRMGLLLARRAGSVGKTVLAVCGAVTVASAGLDYRWDREREEARLRAKGKDAYGGGAGSADGRGRVLVLPFYRMKVVERKQRSPLSALGSRLRKHMSSLGGEDDESPIEIELHELVEAIHEAARDPDIAGLYGLFGYGYGFSCGGYAHLEEIRNAVRVFNESHRFHRCPNVDRKDPAAPPCRDAKTSHAFADSFGNLADTGNKEYFLASEFSQIYMQPQGQLILSGVSTKVPFFRSALDKYGITAHVLRHGKFKNAGNSLSETGFTRDHKENVMAILNSLNGSICQSIARSRSLPASFDWGLWKALHDYGILTGPNAREVGLVDFLPPVDPLPSLLSANEAESDGADSDGLGGLKTISLRDFSARVARNKKSESRQWKIHTRLQNVAERSSATRQLLSLFRYDAPHYNIDEEEYQQSNRKSERRDKIAVVHVTGGIESLMAKKIAKMMGKIKKDEDIKAVVLRVDSPGGSALASDLIFEALRDLPKPIVCSMSNFAASGGYYVSAHCDRIFALPTTLTGSIGVFAVKFDATRLASSYGVNVERIGSSPFADFASPFQPLSPKVKEALRRNMDSTYEIFKDIVSSGRKLTAEQVECIAQGRVWTGVEAKERGLVDEIGGLSRAISYTQSQFTSTGDAEVEFWPKSPTFSEALSILWGGDVDGTARALSSIWAVISNDALLWAPNIGAAEGVAGHLLLDNDQGPITSPGTALPSQFLQALSANALPPEAMLTMTEADAIRCSFQGSDVFPPSFWI